MKLRPERLVRWLVAFALLTMLVTMVGAASAAPNTDMFDPDVRLSDGFFPPAMGNALIVTSTCAPNSDLTQPSTVTISSRSSGNATIPGAPFGGWVNGSLTWQLTAGIGGQTEPAVGEFWPFTIDGAPTGSHGLPTGQLTSFSGQFSIDRGAPGLSAEDIAGTLSLGPGGGNWGVCRKYANEPSGTPNPGGFLTGAIHSLHAGSLTYTVTQGPAGLLGETGDAAGTLMNSYATGNGCQIPCGPDHEAIATGHFRLEFGTTIPGGGSTFTDAGTGPPAPVKVEPMPDVTIEFTDVTGGGITNVVKTTDAPVLPGGFQLAGDGLFYEIKTSAGVVFPATVCFPTGGLPAPEILHFEGGTWVPVATTIIGDQACGQVTSLSPFAVGTSHIYNVSGPFQPVDTQPTVNTMKAGRTVPVKFKLGGNHGLNVFAAGYPLSQNVSCSGGGVIDEVETTSAGNSGLSYDPVSSTYQYNWKTENSWKGQCRTLVLKFSDGQELKASFKFN